MYLVTGGAGFIGSHTVRALLARGERVRVLDDLSTGSRSHLAGLEIELQVGDVADPHAVATAMDGCDRVIHLAALASVPGSCAEPVHYDRVNLRGSLVVFEAAREAGVERLVYASSSAVYGSTDVLPVHEALPLRPESPYAVAKAGCELYGRVYSQTLGLSCVGLRYFNVFGPRQDPEGPYAAVIPRFVEHALAGRPLTIFGDGEQGRDFVSVADVARANVLASTVPMDGGAVLNIGGGRMTTINALAAAVCDRVGVVDAIEHAAPRPGDIRFSLADIRRAQEVLGWRPEADFDAAMAETIAWYRQRIEG